MHATNLCFLIPFYNQPLKIKNLIEILGNYSYPILLIDDGSNEECKDILSKLNHPHLNIYTRMTNGGKGAAIKMGFDIARKRGFTHCFQIDADMQHDLKQIPLFLKRYEEAPDTLICANPKYGEDVPKSRLYGRKITNFWVQINTLGGGLKDTMCGMRIYPIEKMQNAIAKTHSNRMDFDIEILLYAYQDSLEFQWIDVKVMYETNGISHFQIIKDNLRISKIHTKHFFLIPYTYFARKKIQKKQRWWEHQERANLFWLKITLICVIYLPYWFLRFLIIFVTTIYFVFSIKERKNLQAFHSKLKMYYPQDSFENLHAYQHFYAFGECICDKFAVWSNKIKYQDLLFANEEQKNIGFSAKHGQIILVSHFGNIEIARAMEKNRKNKMNILVHSKNAKYFNEMINQVSGVRFGVFEVENLGIKEMLRLKECIDQGENIGIMGDRISFGSNQNKNIKIKFLGEDCLFPSGAFLLAGILQCPISMLWCEKRKGKYLITYEPLAEKIILGKNKLESIYPYLQQYVHALEERIRHNPTQWFNFFDFWNQK